MFIRIVNAMRSAESFIWTLSERVKFDWLTYVALFFPIDWKFYLLLSLANSIRLFYLFLDGYLIISFAISRFIATNVSTYPSNTIILT